MAVVDANDAKVPPHARRADLAHSSREALEIFLARRARMNLGHENELPAQYYKGASNWTYRRKKKRNMMHNDHDSSA